MPIFSRPPIFKAFNASSGTTARRRVRTRNGYFKRFHYDTVCRNVPAFRMALSMFGAKQIMFGTDIPLREDIELQRRDIEALGLTAAELDDIYACNAARLLGISLSGSPNE
jgi:predicted TIM-barrel fold metal-dependent hydrolase